MIHLDTSFLIQALVTGSAADAKLQAWLTSGEDLAISSIALSEFLCGPVTAAEAQLVETLLGSPEPFLATDASKAANSSTPLPSFPQSRRLPNRRRGASLRREPGDHQRN